MKTPGLPLKLFVLLPLFLCLVFTSCRHHATQVTRGFYYWKSDQYSLTDSGMSYITSAGIKKLYVKLFEVVPEPFLGSIPTAKTLLHISSWDTVAKVTERIPVVFIKNEVLVKISKTALDSLADNIVFLTGKYAQHISVGKEGQAGQDSLTEIQIDCDWTARTKDNYFYLLRAIKKRAKVDISCTLRLYPYKYPEKMGIPPVDKAMLMCYNLISPVGNDDKNSILDVNELKAYLRNGKRYPLHLDIALPLYSWMQYYKDGRLRGLIYHNHQALKQVLKPVKPLWYEVTRDTVIGDYYLRPGDQIKYEAVTAAQLNESIRIIKESIAFDAPTTISFFHLDDEQLQQYSHATLDSLYDSFSR